MTEKEYQEWFDGVQRSFADNRMAVAGDRPLTLNQLKQWDAEKVASDGAAIGTFIGFLLKAAWIIFLIIVAITPPFIGTPFVAIYFLCKTIAWLLRRSER